MKGIKKNGLYVLERSSALVLAIMKDIFKIDRTMLWHFRFGHMSIKEIQELSKQELLCGYKIIEFDLCEICIFGKAHRSNLLRGCMCLNNL